MLKKLRPFQPDALALVCGATVILMMLGLLLALSACSSARPDSGGYSRDETGQSEPAEPVPEPAGDGTVFADTSPVEDSGDGSILDPTGIPVGSVHSAISGLDAELAAALQAAAARAREEGIELRVTSGWRSPELQRQLLDDAVQRYGSESEARKWVDTPERSTHVTGAAVDIGGLEESLWVGQYGAEFGLCQTFENERWHFELTEIQADGTCPAPPYMSAAERPE